MKITSMINKFKLLNNPFQKKWIFTRNFLISRPNLPKIDICVQ